ncbi:MAG: tetratricopeptide repeat protein, partial [Deltaproteobacteria bacterium]|nr:tetratricopeptide repeat protein [Deltaproteobacteria bacterium]
WNINYGHYLADSRRFSEALAVFRIAVDLTEAPGIKAEAHLERGTVLSRNLDEPLPALDEYMSVIESYPVEPFIENALFSAGLINMELGEKKRALDLFTRYMDGYPEGAHRDTVEVFIRTLEKD